jgi:hypothetical protein
VLQPRALFDSRPWIPKVLFHLWWLFSFVFIHGWSIGSSHPYRFHRLLLFSSMSTPARK